MTFDMLLVLLILSSALVFFITEWLRMDIVALIVMSLLAITGLVTTKEAVAGFSNPAVVTIWAMFILSEGLTHTGIADLIGRIFHHGKNYSEIKIIAIFMLTAGLISGFMNNIAVISLMMPVVLDISRRFGILPSRVL
ncbi:MAG TPA: SLC13 family permease, partial [Actinobacteria bacterium]|nr:SLC13 family permease [Actinomycetota bacterium]